MQKLISLLLSTLLVLGLTACGATGTIYSGGDNDILGDEHTTNRGNTLFGGDSSDKGKLDQGNTARSADGGSLKRSSDSKSDQSSVYSYNSFNPANGEADSDGVSYEHMLDNARVHDRDGNLLDGENSHWTK